MVTNLLQWSLQNHFIAAGIMEAPTLLMSIAQIQKKYRNDKLFGVTFFATRIMFHVYYIWHLGWGSTVFNNTWIFIYPSLVLPLHVMWFKGWISQQMRIKTEKKHGHPSSQHVQTESPSLQQKKAHLLSKTATLLAEGNAATKPTVSSSPSSSMEYLVSSSKTTSTDPTTHNTTTTTATYVSSSSSATSKHSNLGSSSPKSSGQPARRRKFWFQNSQNQQSR
jgi:hypothetical protein